ncbi:MAG TPA: hypothetical protein VGV59_16720 [Pyrinomonadaceae bacterium]|nr:hypothetical protein [Pyrinomonadaceae bacterium]
MSAEGTQDISRFHDVSRRRRLSRLLRASGLWGQLKFADVVGALGFDASLEGVEADEAGSSAHLEGQLGLAGAEVTGGVGIRRPNDNVYLRVNCAS